MKIYQYIRGAAAVLVGVLCVAAFVGAFYPLKIFDVQISALMQRVLVDFSFSALVLLIILLGITLLFGRIYCSTLCPFGLLQECLMLLFRVFRKKAMRPQVNRPYKYFLAAVVFGALLGGTVFFVRLIAPYTLFGSAMSGMALGMGAVVVVAVLVWFKGRYFCSNICPVGAVLGVLSRYSLFKIYIDDTHCAGCRLCVSKCPTGSIDIARKKVDNETCIKCFRCLGVCRFSGMHYGIRPTIPQPFNEGRRHFLIGGAALMVCAAAVRGGSDLVRAAVSKVKNVLLPAGAGSAEDFAARCLNCNLCVQNCPMKILKKATGDCRTVHIDYTDSFCDYNCNRCSQVCPSGAIKRLALTDKQRTKIGTAAVDTTVCVQCGLCVMECPREAIRKEKGAFPQVNADECIGCGACQCVCPVKAITVTAVEKQRLL